MDDEIENALADIRDGLHSVEIAVRRVETAVKDKWSTVQWLGLMVIGGWLLSLPGDLWHSKWRYAANYGVTADKVITDDHPHDCTFVTPPFGEK
jgi:hypothetical protein